jgi:hypothetical protein
LSTYSVSVQTEYSTRKPKRVSLHWIRPEHEFSDVNSNFFLIQDTVVNVSQWYQGQKERLSNSTGLAVDRYKTSPGME